MLRSGALFLGGIVPGLIMAVAADGHHRARCAPAPVLRRGRGLAGRRSGKALAGAAHPDDHSGRAARRHLERGLHADRIGRSRRASMRLLDLGLGLPRLRLGARSGRCWSN